MVAARLQHLNLPTLHPIHKKTTRTICNPKSNPEMAKYFEISAPEYSLFSAPDYSFGPFYTESESDSCKGAKEKAWAKIIEKERIERKKILLKEIEKEIKKWEKEEVKKMRENMKWEEEIREWKEIIEEELTEWKKRIEEEGTEKKETIIEEELTEWKKTIEKERTKEKETIIGKTRSEWRNKVVQKITEIRRTEWKKNGTDEDYANQRYMDAMGRVEKEARAAYGGDAALVDVTESQFRWMMIKDGCFFLQLTLSLLNASVPLDLNYPANDPILREKPSNKTFMGLIKSMFLVGNQIPLVVLSELMNQKYFRTIIDGLQGWERPSDMLSKQILYHLLVDPVISNGKSSSLKNSETSSKLRARSCWSMHAKKPTYYSSHQEKPCDLLHGLQLFLLGPADDQKAASLDEGGELLDEELEHRDLEAGIKLSASNLAKKGIYIWKNSKGGGCRGIHFKSRFLWGSLFMPPLKVNHETNVLFTNLKYYEIVHQQKEVRSYINFLANLVSTYEDVNVLASNKIIDKHTKSEDKERFLEMLGNLSDKEVLFTHRHNSVIGRVKDHSVFPWYIFKYLGILVFVLTILQALFGILSYQVGVKQLHQQEFGFNSTA